MAHVDLAEAPSAAPISARHHAVAGRTDAAAAALATAIIPARGGSLGLPGKNLARVGGVPLVTRAVHAALSATRIGRVVVTTDDEAIADTARNAGAEVVARPADLAGSTA